MCVLDFRSPRMDPRETVVGLGGLEPPASPLIRVRPVVRVLPDPPLFHADPSAESESQERTSLCCLLTNSRFGSTFLDICAHSFLKPTGVEAGLVFLENSGCDKCLDSN